MATEQTDYERGRDLGAQEQFERDVRAACIHCRDGYAPMQTEAGLFHYGAKECRASVIRVTSPARAARLDARPSA